jgi:hypothetical protein
MSVTTTSAEKTALLETLAKQRFFLRHTVRDLDDEQAGRRTTVSALCLGGLIKHVTAVEKTWADFVVDGPAAHPDVDWATIDWSNPPAFILEHQNGFRMLEGETLADLLAAYDAVAAGTDELVETVDLDASHPLPKAPWFEPDASWSARRVFVHIVAETAQHAGHADIIRETIDGQRSMG